jgi:c-di-AMP phosphodiesterase-like protein
MESLEELMMTGEFESTAEIFNDCVVIARMELDRPGTPQDRIVASKVAEKLLNVKDVEASFAMIRMNGDVVISGRSKGNINVQLILERLKGGGHFDIAGAQIKNSTLSQAFGMLTGAIGDYFTYDHKIEEE